MASPTELSSREALERFVVGNADLERLEALLAEFNLFEAMGAVRVELRHSDFLAFILDPSRNHGLGDLFLKLLLKRILLGLEDASVSAVDIDVWDLRGAAVVREWMSIDILIRDEANRLVVAIENKIDSGEGEGQLARYEQTVNKHFPGWATVLVFLTPEGNQPSLDSYLPVDYGLVRDCVADVLESRRSTLGEDVAAAIRHYEQMLRRHIVADSDIAELARRIYEKHRTALDLIYEHRPDLQSLIADQLHGLIDAEESLVSDHCTKGYVRFSPRAWDSIESLHEGEGWTKSGRIMLFEFKNQPSFLRLYLLIGPGPQEVRERAYSIAQKNPDLFAKNLGPLYGKWKTIWVKPVLSAKDLRDLSPEEIHARVEKAWGSFLQALPKLVESIEQAGL